MVRKVSNIAASVHQRLLNRAKSSSRLFSELLQYFAIERFIYRLSRTRQADKFILKGALMLPVWSGAASRPTMDIDFLARTANDPTVIADAIRDACILDVEPDGMFFDPGSVTAAKITEDAIYEGVRVRVRGSLGPARVSLQVDVGFGDIIVPGPILVSYPALLDFPPAQLAGYTRESTIAEKLQAMDWLRPSRRRSGIERRPSRRHLRRFSRRSPLTRTGELSGRLSPRNPALPTRPKLSPTSWHQSRPSCSLS